MPDTTDAQQSGSTGRRLAWFFGIALASSAVTATVAYALRALLRL